MVGPHDLGPRCGLTVTAAACPASTIITSDLRHTGNEQANMPNKGFSNQRLDLRCRPGGPVPFYFGDPSPTIKGPSPGLQLGSTTGRTPSLPRGLFHPQEIPHWPGQPPCCHYPRPQHRMFWKMQPPDSDARVARFRIGWSRSRCTKGPVWVLIGRSRANGDKPGGGPITQGEAHLKFSNRVFLRFLVQWDRSGRPQVVRIWGKPFGCGRSAVPGQQDAKRPPSSCLRRLPVDGRLRLHTRPPTSFRFGGEMLLGR
jgi:hypothetical protein